MAISFESIPSSLRVPFVACEFNSSQAQQGPSVLAYRGLIIGQKTSAGTATANTLVRVTNANQALTYGGRGSQLHRMAKAWFANNKFTEVWLGVLGDDSGGTAASGTLTVTGPATAAGTISLYLGGELVSLAVASGASAIAIASSLKDAINANLDLPVTAAVGGSGSEHIITVTHRHKGTVGNSYDMRVNYQYGQALPAGVGIAVVALANGETDPSLTSLIAAMGDTWFHIIANPYTDDTSLDALETELASRSGPMRMIDGLAIASAAGSQSTLAALGNTRNSQFSSIIAQPGASPLTPPSEFAAAVAAVTAYHGAIDPARPMQTLPLAGVLPPADGDLFTNEERNLLLYDGIATTRVGAGSVVQMDRLITTYQTNAAGADDTAYLDASTVLTLMYLRYSFRTLWATRYPRHKLANDGTRAGAGQAIMTPKLAKAEAIAWFRSMEQLGLVEGFDQFKRDLVVERNASDPNRLDVLLPPDLVNQLIVTAAQVGFRL